MATIELATWISKLSYPDLPQPVVDAAIRSFQNALGCVIGGSNHLATQRALQALQLVSSASTCTVFGQSVRTPKSTSRVDLQTAVLINGIASHVHDYDDTHLHTVIHPAGAIVVVLLAFAEHVKLSSGKSTSGQAFITALVAGLETSLRIGNAISPNHYDEGWHITGTVSSIAVAAAVSSFLALDVHKTVHAIGIAATQVTGIRVHFGTDTKAFHVGRAAQNGLLAAMLAEGGFTAATDALEGRRGWIEVLGNGANTLQREIEGLQRCSAPKNAQDLDRQLWEIEKNTFKPFPCGIVIHPIIDACIQLHGENNLNEDDKLAAIEKVEMRVHHLVLDLTGKKTPKNGLEAKFSVYHGATIGLIFGSATPREYEDSIVNLQNVQDLRAKISAEIDADVRSDEAHIKVFMNDGRVLNKHVENAVGSLARPMTNKELEIKFIDQTEPILGKAAAAHLNELAWKVLDLEDLGAVVEASA